MSVTVSETAGDVTGAVLAGVDGSDFSYRAARWAADFAERERRELVLIVCDAAAVPLAEPYAPIPVGVVERISEYSKTVGGEVAAAIAAEFPAVRLRSAVLSGRPGALLCDLSGGARCVVVGTRGVSGFRSLLLGSVSADVALHAECPVAIVRGEKRDGPVVVGIDGTPTSDGAEAEAFRQASLRGTRLVAVQTWTDLSTDALYGYGLTDADLQQLSEEAAESLSERLAGWGEEYPDVEVERVIVPASPAERLIEESRRAQLVVVGSHRHRGVRRFLLGSTSRTVTTHAHCPVLVVRDVGDHHGPRGH